MAMRSSRFTNIRGRMYEFASENLIREDRHNHREAESQKSQFSSRQGIARNKNSKDIKIPIKHKMT